VLKLNWVNRRLGQRGITVIAALVGAALVGIAVFIVMKGFQHFSAGRLGLTRRLQGDEFLVAAAAGLQQSDFSDVLGQCRTTGVLNIASPRTGVCVKSGVLDPALGVTRPSLRPWTLEVVRDEFGKPAADGTQCAELLWCRHLASGRILEVLIQGNWRDGRAEHGLVQRRLTVRRTRW
jgi:hypothetical protein